MHKNFEINQTKIKSGSQLGRKVAPHDSKSDLPLAYDEPCVQTESLMFYDMKIAVHLEFIFIFLICM